MTAFSAYLLIALHPFHPLLAISRIAQGGDFFEACCDRCDNVCLGSIRCILPCLRCCLPKPNGGDCCENACDDCGVCFATCWHGVGNELLKLSRCCCFCIRCCLPVRARVAPSVFSCAISTCAYPLVHIHLCISTCVRSGRKAATTWSVAATRWTNTCSSFPAASAVACVVGFRSLKMGKSAWMAFARTIGCANAAATTAAKPSIDACTVSASRATRAAPRSNPAGRDAAHVR